MSCEVREHLVAYADGELPSDLRREVEAHLAECPSCAQELAELEATRTLLKRWPAPQPSAEARSRAWGALQGRAQPSAARSAGRRVWVRALVRYALPLAAAAAVLLVVTVPWGGDNGAAVPDELIAELPVLENLEMLEALDVLTEWDNLQALAALEPAPAGDDSLEVVQ